MQGPPGGKPPNMQQVGSQPPMPLSGTPSGPPSGPPSLNAASGPNSLNSQQFNQRPSSGAPISPPISQPPRASPANNQVSTYYLRLDLFLSSDLTFQP